MPRRDYVSDLDNSMPAAKSALLCTNLQSLINKVNGITNLLNGAELLVGPVTLSRGTPDTTIGSTAFNYSVNGVVAQKAAANTAIGAQTVTADRWALYRLTIASGGTITVTPAAGNAAGYTSEGAAIAAIPAVPANQVDMGYITVKTKVGTTFVAATDALAGGATGNVASVTHYVPATAGVDVTPITSLTALP